MLVAARMGGDLLPLVDGLRAVDPAALGPDARVAFWVNVYNARVRTAVRDMRGDLRAHRGFFRRTSWVVGGIDTSLHVMEHGILRGNRRAPYTLWRALGASDARIRWVARLDPRVHFALNCGAASCPPVRSYTAGALDEQLTLATRAYLDGEVAIEGAALRLPWLCRLYRGDFEDVRAFAAAHVDADRAAWIRANPKAPLRWGPYRWEIQGEA